MLYSALTAGPVPNTCEAKRRLGHLVRHFRFRQRTYIEITWRMRLRNGLTHRVAGATLPKLPREIEKSYQIKGEAAVLGPLRF
jgi:hypothetical protein